MGGVEETEERSSDKKETLDGKSEVRYLDGSGGLQEGTRGVVPGTVVGFVSPLVSGKDLRPEYYVEIVVRTDVPFYPVTFSVTSLNPIVGTRPPGPRPSPISYLRSLR